VRSPPAAHKRAEATLVAHALTFAEAHEDWPWEERVIKVRGKIFAFLGMVEGTLRLGVKLPVSAEMALTLPYVSPSRYGLGRSGWVTAHLPRDEKPDLDLMRGWIDQSYRAVAPKKLVRALDG